MFSEGIWISVWKFQWTWMWNDVGKKRWLGEDIWKSSLSLICFGSFFQWRKCPLRLSKIDCRKVISQSLFTWRKNAVTGRFSPKTTSLRCHNMLRNLTFFFLFNILVNLLIKEIVDPWIGRLSLFLPDRVLWCFMMFYAWFWWWIVSSMKKIVFNPEVLHLNGDRFGRGPVSFFNDKCRWCIPVLGGMLG